MLPYSSPLFSLNLNHSLAKCLWTPISGSLSKLLYRSLCRTSFKIVTLQFPFTGTTVVQALIAAPLNTGRDELEIHYRTWKPGTFLSSVIVERAQITTAALQNLSRCLESRLSPFCKRKTRTVSMLLLLVWVWARGGEMDVMFTCPHTFGHVVHMT